MNAKHTQSDFTEPAPAQPAASQPSSAQAALAAAVTSSGQTVAQLSQSSPVLLVFLRHFGCTFCREAMADVASQQPAIKAGNVQIVLVHMGEGQIAEKYLQKYGLGNLPHISDPQQSFYKAMGLRRGTLGQLFGLKSWIRGFTAGILSGHLVGKLAGDGFQMPGVFLISRGQIIKTFRHTSAADRPDYTKLACQI